MTEPFLDGRVTLWAGDCLDVLARMDEASVDSCVTDPPYHLVSMVRRFGADNAKPALSAAQRRFAKTGGADRKPCPDQYGRLGKGFMGQQWDGGDIAFRPETWAAVLRVLKPGAHLVAFGAPKNAHRLACAIEDAGFEIRDTIMWLFGSGFPKSHDVSKGIDRAAGVEREVVGRKRNNKGDSGVQTYSALGAFQQSAYSDVAAPATDAAAQWSGWGTALKPAYEPIILARKPLSEGTIAANVLRWGTGAINVDGCRVETDWPNDPNARGWQGGNSSNVGVANFGAGGHDRVARPNNGGRWPANVAHDGSAEVVEGFPQTTSGVKQGGQYARETGVHDGGQRIDGTSCFGDTGSAARFFYTAKADANDRTGSKHPTVKPLDLMQWLVRLVTPQGGFVLDLFAGTGTTGEAAWREGMRAVLIEREEKYCADIRRRMALVLAGPEERERESLKASGRVKGHEDLPLFGGNPWMRSSA